MRCRFLLFGFGCLCFLVFFSGLVLGQSSVLPPVIATVNSETHICPACGLEHSILTVTDTVTPEPVARQGFFKRFFSGRSERKARRSERSSVDSDQVSLLEGSDQNRAAAEAREMAELDYRSHVADTIGNFEGVGSSCRGLPGTCTPSKRRVRKDNLVLTGDSVASAPCPDCPRTRQYRVRSWRSFN